MNMSLNSALLGTALALGLGMLPQVAQAGSIVSYTNLTLISAPAIVGDDFLTNQSLPDAVIFYEQQNVTLTSALVTETGVIPRGTVVDSAFFAVQSLSSQTLSSSVTFGGAVLGVVYEDGSADWAASDFLGAPGTTYDEDPDQCAQCGFDPSDTLTVEGDTVDFTNIFSQPGDFARIIYAPPPTPEPGSILLFGAGLAFLGTRLRKRIVSSNSR
jgi:hypothetical protein